jgi:hypothetical protein
MEESRTNISMGDPVKETPSSNVQSVKETQVASNIEADKRLIQSTGKRVSFAWDYDEKTVRGSFMNVMLTAAYLVIIAISMIFPSISKNVSEITSFLIGFYLVSFGVWATKKTVEIVRTAKTIMPDKYGDMISKIFEQVSVTPTNGQENHNGAQKTKEKELAK